MIWGGSPGFLFLLIKSLVLQSSAPDAEGRSYHGPWKSCIVPWLSFPSRWKEKGIIFKVHSTLSAVQILKFTTYHNFLNLGEYFKGLKVP